MTSNLIAEAGWLEDEPVVMEKLSVIGRVKTREKSPYLELSDVLASPDLAEFDVRSFASVVGLRGWSGRPLNVGSWPVSVVCLLTSRGLNVSQTSPLVLAENEAGDMTTWRLMRASLLTADEAAVGSEC